MQGGENLTLTLSDRPARVQCGGERTDDLEPNSATSGSRRTIRNPHPQDESQDASVEISAESRVVSPHRKSPTPKTFARRSNDGQRLSRAAAGHSNPQVRHCSSSGSEWSSPDRLIFEEDLGACDRCGRIAKDVLSIDSTEIKDLRACVAKLDAAREWKATITFARRGTFRAASMRP